MDEKTKAQIQQEAADLVAKLQPRSGKFRTISPEMDPLRLGSGWSIEDLDKPQVIIESTFGDSHPGSAGLFELVEEVRAGVAEAGGHGAVTSAPISATARPRATTALTTRCPAAT